MKEALEIKEKLKIAIKAKKKRDKLFGFLFPTLLIVVLIVIWQMAVVGFKVPEYLFPGPGSILKTMANEFVLLASHGYTTTYEAIIGFFMAIAFGVPCAILIVWSRPIERALMPLLVFSQTMPKVAIAPLFLIWFGFGILPKIIVAFLICFFPIVISTAAGLKAVEEEILDLIRSMSASTFQIFVKARIPNSLPYFISGVKVSITLAVIGAIVGEFVGADRGLGYIIMVANGNLDAKLLFAAIFALAIIGYGLFAIVTVLERILMPWHVGVRQEGGIGEATY